ncbi:MAG: aminotransferase class V-fold PLP-dependent enzyme [Chitinivibrionales bacterium]|nr:aminotransferase class V-fold PLP-dependent enzyme [Chitinivibrionales bacterium]
MYSAKAGSVIYLNNAATSYPKPPGVRAAVARYADAVPFHEDRSGCTDQEANPMRRCREEIGRLLNVNDIANVAFTSGATESLNLAIDGLLLHDAHVITTAIEHNSVLRPLKRLEQEGRISLSIVRCDEFGMVEAEAICNKITRKTQLIVVNHCSNVTGTVLDVRKIVRLAHAKNIPVLVDASQSAGMVPIDFDGWDIVELVPGEKMVVRAYDYYEADSYEKGKAPRMSAYMIRGVSAAFMDLAYGGDYDPTGKTGCHTFTCQQTKGIECGDEYGEFVVTRA